MTQLDDKTLRLIDQILTYNEALITTLYFDYNELEPEVREKKWKEHYAASRAIREITGFNAYQEKCKQEAQQKILDEIEQNKEYVESFISKFKENLSSINNPQYYRNYSLNKEATSAADVFKVTIEQHPSVPPVEPTYPNATKDEWLVAIENAKKHFEEEYENAKQYNNPDSEDNKTFAAAFGLPHNHFFPPVVLKDVFVDEDVLAITSGFMLGPVGMFNNKAVQAGYPQKYDNIHEMLIFLKAQAKTQDIIIYLTYKEGDKYWFRGAFVDKK